MSLAQRQGRLNSRFTQRLRRLELRHLRPVVAIGVLLAAAWLGPRASRGMLLVLLGIPVLGLLLRLPKLQLPLLLLAAAFVPLEISTGTYSSINIAMLGVAALSGLWLLRAMLEGDMRLRPSPANLPWLLFTLVAGLSVIAGAALWSPWVVTKSTFLLVQGAQWSIIALSACAYWLGANRVRDRQALGQLVVLMLAFGTAFLALLYLPYLNRFGVHFLQAGPTFRICIASLAASMALYRPEIGRRSRLALGALALGMVLLPYLEGSGWASGWLPTCLSLIGVFCLWAWDRIRWRVVPYAAVGAVFGVFFLIVWFGQGEYYSLDTRMIAWRGVLQLLEGRWLLGLGLASYWHYWRGVLGSMTYFDPETGYLHYTFDPQVNLHNNYMDVLAQMGVLGLAALILLFAALAFSCYRRYQAEPPGFGKAYAAAALATLGGMAASGMLGDWFMPFVYNIGLRGFRDSFMGWLLLGGVIVLDATAEARAEDSIRPSTGSENPALPDADSTG